MLSFPDSISLASGYGSFLPPAVVVGQVATALQAGAAAASSIEGLPELRAAIARRYQRQGARVEPGQVVVTPGAKPALFALFNSLLQPGDEVLLLTPNWFGFRGLVEKAGGILRSLPLDPADDYAFHAEKLEAALTPRTRILVFSNPNNPTGRVYSRPELESLLSITRQHPDLVVLADEIYDGIHFGPGRMTSLLEFDDSQHQHVVVNGFSKSLALIGWSVGYLVAPTAIARHCSAWLFTTATAVAALSQVAALAATENAEAISRELCAGLISNREMLRAGLAAIPQVQNHFPAGTYYAFPDFRAFLNSELEPTTGSAELAARLRGAGVEVVDGASCGAPGFYRLSYAVPEPLLREALRRLTVTLAAG
ncbi:pyridoxal phosphate-dependent aminotransferase [Hymenobacter elongatus]|uniref:Aminotransferase class I/II-fold pyridoxal phosphate-dependent enzyme n=1 Tax=Hymenobacter elongatus TaxID=877208 RepID=A0A4Z0PS15_9BACT|nr:aminotransferase class I/II-fold pyridoxal phosphate-dependent enzyme [Hymenobacter elongatus]TGE18602.1 aminotransferase class I/II-fold pyridoxal phosphate-dependent enzyme [Hymenobacter elongatus]